MKALLASVILASACASVGCNTPSSAADAYVVNIDPSFTDSEVETIISSFDTWENDLFSAHSLLTVSFQANAECSRNSAPAYTICLHRTDSNYVDSVDGAVPIPGEVHQAVTMINDFIGGNQASDIYFAMDTMTDPGTRADFAHNVKHETGHAFGLHHSTAGVMFWNSQGADYSVSATDVNQYMFIRGETNEKQFVLSNQ